MLEINLQPATLVRGCGYIRMLKTYGLRTLLVFLSCPKLRTVVLKKYTGRKLIRAYCRVAILITGSKIILAKKEPKPLSETSQTAKLTESVLQAFRSPGMLFVSESILVISRHTVVSVNLSSAAGTSCRLKTGRYSKYARHLINQINIEIKQLNVLLGNTQE